MASAKFNKARCECTVQRASVTPNGSSQARATRNGQIAHDPRARGLLHHRITINVGFAACCLARACAVRVCEAPMSPGVNDMKRADMAHWTIHASLVAPYHGLTIHAYVALRQYVTL